MNRARRKARRFATGRGWSNPTDVSKRLKTVHACRCHADPWDSAGKRTAPGSPAYEEMLYGIEGVVTWTVDGTPIEVGPGQALCIPRGAVHRFDNFGGVDAKQLAVISPAIMGPEYFREAVAAMRAAGGGPADRATMVEVFRRHGMTVAEGTPVR